MSEIRIVISESKKAAGKAKYHMLSAENEKGRRGPLSAIIQRQRLAEAPVRCYKGGILCVRIRRLLMQLRSTQRILEEGACRNTWLYAAQHRVVFWIMNTAN